MTTAMEALPNVTRGTLGAATIYATRTRGRFHFHVFSILGDVYRGTDRKRAYSALRLAAAACEPRWTK